MECTTPRFCKLSTLDIFSKVSWENMLGGYDPRNWRCMVFRKHFCTFHKFVLWILWIGDYTTYAYFRWNSTLNSSFRFINFKPKELEEEEKTVFSWSANVSFGSKIAPRSFIPRQLMQRALTLYSINERKI